MRSSRAPRHIEGGFKSEVFGHRLLVNMTIFSTLVRGYQAIEAVGVGKTATKFLANVGAVRSQGMKLETEATPAPGLHLRSMRRLACCVIV